VLVGRSFSDLSGSMSMAAMDPQTLAFEEIALPFSRPHAIGAVPGGRYALASSLAETNQMVLIDLEAAGGPEIVDLALVETSPTALVQFAVAPDAGSAVLTSQLTSELVLLDLDLENGTVSQSGIVSVGQQPWHPIYSPDGSRVYVPNRQSHSVSFVDPAAGMVTRTVSDPRFSQPHGATVSDDGRTLFVSHRNTADLGADQVRYTPRYALGPATATGLVTAIDTETGEVIAVIETGAWASGMAYYSAD
jgi:YVTN family beta-propeller protein